VVACGDDDAPPPAAGTPDSSVPDTSVDQATGATVVDGGPDVDVPDAPAADAEFDANDVRRCPIIGAADDQMSFGTGSCNACVREKCCTEFTTCFTATKYPDRDSLFYADGGTTSCFERFFCFVGCLDTGGDPDSCTTECDPQFDAGDNQAVKALWACGTEGTYPAGCGLRPDGGALCQ
jgi:hypothetical protein